MHKGLHTKLLSAFLLIFVCLNGGGAICLAYCQGFELEASRKTNNLDHCQKSAEALEQNAIAFSVESADCCPMTVSFVAGPIEKRMIDLAEAALTAGPAIEFTPPQFTSQITHKGGFNYRGPPIDRRIDRLKNCILRI